MHTDMITSNATSLASLLMHDSSHFQTQMEQAFHPFYPCVIVNLQIHFSLLHVHNLLLVLQYDLLPILHPSINPNRLLFYSYPPQLSRREDGAISEETPWRNGGGERRI